MRKHSSRSRRLLNMPSGRVILWTSAIALFAVLLYQRNGQVKNLVDNTVGRLIPA